MRRALLLAAVLVAVVAPIGNAQDPSSNAKPLKGRLVSVDAASPASDAAGPKGLPPEFAMALIHFERESDGKSSRSVVLHQYEFIAGVSAERSSSSRLMERPLRKMWLMFTTHTKTIGTQHKLSEIRADVDGKNVSADRLAELLQEAKHVLVTTDGKKLDPFYLKIIKKEGTIVLVIPQSGLPAGVPYSAGIPVCPATLPRPLEFHILLGDNLDNCSREKTHRRMPLLYRLWRRGFISILVIVISIVVVELVLIVIDPAT